MRKAKDTDQEEAEELNFVPSAISVPKKLMFRCDNLCNEKTLSFWQLASVVIKEGEEIIHYQLMPEMLQRDHDGKRGKTTDKLAAERVRGAQDAPWKALENDGKEQYEREMWEYFCRKRNRVKRFREPADEERQEGI